MAENILTHNLSEPLDGATRAKVEITANSGAGKVSINTK
jgi:hypothetical protein